MSVDKNAYNIKFVVLSNTSDYHILRGKILPSTIY